MTDKLTGRIKCPGLGCHSADVQIVGKKGLFKRKINTSVENVEESLPNNEFDYFIHYEDNKRGCENKLVLVGN